MLRRRTDTETAGRVHAGSGSHRQPPFFRRAVRDLHVGAVGSRCSFPRFCRANKRGRGAHPAPICHASVPTEGRPARVAGSAPTPNESCNPTEKRSACRSAYDGTDPFGAGDGRNPQRCQKSWSSANTGHWSSQPRSALSQYRTARQAEQTSEHQKFFLHCKNVFLLANTPIRYTTPGKSAARPFARHIGPNGISSTSPPAQKQHAGPSPPGV